MGGEKIVVRTLYRSSLKVCKDLGFRLGSRNENMLVYNSKHITVKYLKRLKKRGMLGDFLGNNVICQYEISQFDIDNNINARIEDGFEGYKYLTEIRNVMNK
jgi:hypothetical protein